VARLAARADVAVAGPRLVDGSGRAELSFGRMISPFNELRQKMTMALYSRGVAAICKQVDGATRREQSVDWVSGACLRVRRAEAEAVGLLDERFFLYTEDVDFCAAIRARGRGVLFTPAAEVVHLGGRSRGTIPAEANRAYRRSHLAFYEKHHPRWAPVLRAYLRVKGQLPR
jgi:N-acetylglucosaminyl-diphospho-decaprenol L-rhamnosyltransferase